MTSSILPPSLSSTSALRVSEWVWSQRRCFPHATLPALVSLPVLRTSFMDQKALDQNDTLLHLLRYDVIFHVEFHKVATEVLKNIMHVYFPLCVSHFDSAFDRYGIGVYYSEKDTHWFWLSWQEKLVILWLVLLMRSASGQPLFLHPRVRPATASESDLQHRVPSPLLVILKTAVAKTTAGSSIMTNSHFWSADTPSAFSAFWGSAVNVHELVDWLEWRDTEIDYLPNLVTTWYDHHRRLTVTDAAISEIRQQRKVVLFFVCSSRLLEHTNIMSSTLLGFQRLLLHNYAAFSSPQTLFEVIAASGIHDDSLASTWFYLKEKVMAALLDPVVYHPVKEEQQLRVDTITLGRHRFAWKRVIRPVLPFIGIKPASAWIDRAPHFLAPYFGFRSFDAQVIDGVLRDLHEVVILAELLALRDTGIAFSYFLSDKHGPCALDIHKHWTLGMQAVNPTHLRTFDLQTEETLVVLPTTSVYWTQLLSLAAYIHQQETREARDVSPMTPRVLNVSAFEWTVAVFGAFQWRGQTTDNYAENCLVDLMIFLRALLTGETDVKRETRILLLMHAKRLLPVFRYYADRLRRPLSPHSAAMATLFGHPSQILFHLVVIGFLPYQMNSNGLNCFHTLQDRKITLDWIQHGPEHQPRPSCPYSRLLDEQHRGAVFWFDNKLWSHPPPAGSSVVADKELYNRGRLESVFRDIHNRSTLDEIAGIDCYIDAQLGLVQPYFHYSPTRLGATDRELRRIPRSLFERWLPSQAVTDTYTVPVDVGTTHQLPTQSATKMISAFGMNHLNHNSDLSVVRYGMECIFGATAQHDSLEERLSFADTRLPMLPLAGHSAWDFFILPHHPSPKQLLSPRLIWLAERASKSDIPCPLLDCVLDSATHARYDAMNDLYPHEPGRGAGQKRAAATATTTIERAPKRPAPVLRESDNLPSINSFSEEEQQRPIYSPTSPTYDPYE